VGRSFQEKPTMAGPWQSLPRKLGDQVDLQTEEGWKRDQRFWAYSGASPAEFSRHRAVA